MTDQNSTQTPETSDTEVVVEPNRLQKFVIKHPRIARALAITAGATAVVGVGLTANTMRKNKHHLDAAAEDARSALNELGESVSPTPETDA